MKKTLLLIILTTFILGTYAQEEARLLRFPAIHGNQVVFSYAGDLYTVAKTGGLATKLTNDEGYEMFARFSPDGKTLAFTAQYDGNTEVYTMPSYGGEPMRLTYTATLGRDDLSDRMGPNNIVMGWKNDKEIIYRSRKKTFNSFTGQLFLANVSGGLSEELPLPTGGFNSYAPDGNKMAYNRVFREFRTWKYYKGGMADDVWIYDFKSKEIENITNNINQDIFPMWHENKVYFLSDRDRTMNMFSYDLVTKETEKVTNYTKYDIKFPSLGDEAIIYENGGFLYTYDLASGETAKLEIKIASDFLHSRSVMKDASQNISSFAISPDGKRLTFGARGDVFTVPVKSGITKNLTQTSSVHDRNVEWSPDGKYISFISDVTGEDEIYIIRQDGSAKAIKMTSNGDTYKYNPIWSPNSKKLLWSDKKLRLQYLDIETKEVTLVVRSEAQEMRDYDWAPDNRWITYTLPKNGSVSEIHIYGLEDKSDHRVTGEWYEVGGPTFSDDGKYLFFSSQRNFNPIYSRVEWNYAYSDMGKVYFVTLQENTPSPFLPENDQVKIAADKKPATESKAKDSKKKADKPEKKAEDKNVKIDFDGIVDRTMALPIAVANYFNIKVLGNSVYYAKFKSGDRTATMMMYDLKAKKETKIGDFANFIFSADKKKMFASTRGRYYVVNTPKSSVKLSKAVDVSNMKVWVNPHKEWKQVFTESWRQMRDFFYAPNMHGLDWPAIHDKYEPLVAHVNDRHDLTYIIGEMIGELSTGHTYVSGGDKITAPKVQLGLLGAELSKHKSGVYQIDKILKGENWARNKKSPFTQVGVKVKEGDFILAVNGKSTSKMKDIYQSLVGTVGDQVELTIASDASGKDKHNEIVIPIADESGLYYLNWVRDNIEKVNKATNGQVGYIHIPDMGAAGLNEFVKYFYPQLGKKALIIDDRGNGGGNVSPMIIERLSRELTMMGMSRNTGVNTKPRQMMVGPKVVLFNNYSASDGDFFAYQFKKLGLGKTIGVRSWGGVVGIRGSLPFIDGGSLQKPEFGPFDHKTGDWIVEGWGVEPDIVLDNDPAKEYAGEDQQLNKAIEVILEEMKNTKPLPKIPPYKNHIK
jgi:tricorn protease